MQTVLITGTSTGFGLLATVELAKRGWRVIATMRNLERKGALDAALAQSGSAANNVNIVQLDVTDNASIARGVAEALAITGGFLDAVVHNAGVAAGGAFEDIPESELRRVMDTNFFGVMELTRALLPTFRKQRKGRIVIMSSESAFNGQPGNAIYVASKWAVEGWAESLAYDVDQFGIDVILIEPGPYITDIWQSSPRILPEGQRLPAVGAQRVPHRGCARRRQGPQSARGGGQDCPRARVAPPALPQSRRTHGALHAHCARQSSRAAGYVASSRRTWVCGASACSLIATAAQALG